MNLEYEALYIPKSLGRFVVPRSSKSIGTFIGAIGALLATRVNSGLFYCSDGVSKLQ